MDPRLAKIEDDMAELKAALELLHTRCAAYETLRRFESEVPRLQAGLERLQAEYEAKYAEYQKVRAEFWALRAELKDHALRDELKAAEQEIAALRQDLLMLRQRIDSELPYLAAREDLQKIFNQTRNWSVATAITLFVALGSVQYTMFATMKSMFTETLAVLQAGRTVQLPATPAPRER